VFHKHHLQTFHPKVYCFDTGGDPPDKAMLLVGSSNLTGGGLFSNFEANLIAHLAPRSSKLDNTTYQSVIAAFDNLIGMPFCEEISTDTRVSKLLKDGYLSTEARLRRRTRESAGKAAKHGFRRNKAEAPPPALPKFKLPTLSVVFADPTEAPSTPLVGLAAPPPAPFVADGRFYGLGSE
jgi:hypothetical protein